MKKLIREIWTVVKMMPYYLIESIAMAFKKRGGNKRLYVLIAIWVIFAYSVVDNTFNGPIMVLYLQKYPLSWTQTNVNYFRSVSNLIRLFGTFIGIFLLKRLLRMSDTLIAVLSLISMLAQAVLIIFSETAWLLYVSSVLGTLASLAYPCMQAFLAKIIKADEVGKAYGIVGSAGVYEVQKRPL